MMKSVKRHVKRLPPKMMVDLPLVISNPTNVAAAAGAARIRVGDIPRNNDRLRFSAVPLTIVFLLTYTPPSRRIVRNSRPM